ncbi:MAG: MerR family DNA-binding transcriptional regulator [Bryobacterales bacterium]|nr:MerR family DNA-binding transcriptional regulator [Bryobacterales bacterium]
MDVLNRGELAEAAQVNIETLRYYERRGLILAPPRSLANYRRYPPNTNRVRFVRHAQDLGGCGAQVSGGTQLRQTATISETRKAAGLAVHLGFARSCEFAVLEVIVHARS